MLVHDDEGCNTIIVEEREGSANNYNTTGALRREKDEAIKGMPRRGGGGGITAAAATAA